MKNIEKIHQAVKSTPVTFMAFDLLMENGVLLLGKSYLDRKKQLEKVITTIDHPLVKFVRFFEDSETLWESVSNVQGEGVIAKRIKSTWQEGQRTKHWLKIKNMIIATFFVLAYDEANAFFHIGCLYKGEIKMIGKVGQGFTKEEKEALVATIKKNQVKTVQSLTYVKPSICIEVEFLEFSRNELRHPKFRRFRLDKNWEDCTWEAIPKLEQN
ncbi:hypothetical protein [Anaerobacillus sp. CMMVII]|uniref:ATP-dependent DNA ligase n=1 Tax=Anaerobacillus sp. CMMVII TaxID=2755588 RepID=UPI0021B6FF0B|nr:hypothetical protein [Anaerobacillus sp. CMMVII]